jgi:Holliday junction resolvase RusA-like endonuclease
MDEANICECNDDKTTIEIIGLAPISVNAMYRSMGHGVIISQRGRLFKNAFTSAIVNNKNTKRIAGAVSVEIHFEFADKRRRDVDNFAKVVLDCAKTLLFDDDSDIWQLLMSKKIGARQNRILIIVSKK